MKSVLPEDIEAKIREMTTDHLKIVIGNLDETDKQLKKKIASTEKELGKTQKKLGKIQSEKERQLDEIFESGHKTTLKTFREQQLILKVMRKSVKAELARRGKE